MKVLAAILIVAFVAFYFLLLYALLKLNSRLDREEERREKEWSEKMRTSQNPIGYDFFQYDGDFKGSDGDYYVPQWAVAALEVGTLYYDSRNPDTPPCELYLTVWSNNVKMELLVEPGDYILRDSFGNIYACKADYFLNNFTI